MDAITGLALLLLFQVAGEAAAHATHLPLPGPVIGLVLVLPALRWEAVRRPVEACARLLLGHLSLLFVPVGVGVITHLDLVESHGAALAVAIVVSTWVGLAVTALVLQALLRRAATAGGEGTRHD